MDKKEFYKKYANSLIGFGKISVTKFSDRVNDLIFELDNYSKYPEIKTCGLMVYPNNTLFEIIIPKYDKTRQVFTFNEIVNDINSLKK